MATALLASTPIASSRWDDEADCDLIARVRAGDDAAFAVLYRRYHRRVGAYIYGVVKDFGRAEDIAQEVFFSALRRMRETDREIAFKPWIYEIAKNACIDHFRRSRRTEEVSYDADEALGAADQRRLVSVGATPDAAVAQKLALDDLRGAFGGLSDMHRDILVMREFEGLSYSQIGARLGLTRPAVESTLFRARRRLTEEYEELVSGARCARVQNIVAAAETAALGTRDRRRLAAHVSHCQPCRRHALRAGIDPALLRAPARVRAKIAALLPLPLFLRRRLDVADPTAVSPGSVHVAQVSAQLSSFADPSVAIYWARAAVAAATIAVAGITAGMATDMVGGGSSAPPKQTVAPVAATSHDVVGSSQARPSRSAGAELVRRARSAAADEKAARMQVEASRSVGTSGPAAAEEAPASSAPKAPGRTGGSGVGAAVHKAFPASNSPNAPAVVRKPGRTLKRTLMGLLRTTSRTAESAVAPVVERARTVVDDAGSAVDGLIHPG